MIFGSGSSSPSFLNFNSITHVSICIYNFLTRINIFFVYSSEPYTEYKIIVIAFTLKYDGEPSDPVIQRTDIAGPTAPQIINLTCHSQDSIYLQWRRPASFYNSIDFYVINYKESSYSNYQQIQLNTSSSYAETAVRNFFYFFFFM
jgi:hypothetical protein